MAGWHFLADGAWAKHLCRPLSNDLRTAAVLAVVGMLPFGLAGGFGSAGDRSTAPWVIGFSTQAVLVLAIFIRRKIR